MPKAEAGTAKAIGNAMKARGLTKLRFYCQVCEKANRDEHAYKMHCESESHMRKLQVMGGSGAGKVIDDFSKQFQDEFVSLLKRRFGTRRIKANQVYQEYIQERHHLHMNATKWVSLTEFVKYLGREGIVVVDENEKGWFIAWIDNSPEALKRQAALQKMERQKMDDEGRERKRLAEMIEKAKKEEGATVEAQQAASSSSSSTQQPQQVEGGLRRDQGPVKLGISLKPSTKPSGTASTGPEASSSTSTPSSAIQASSSSSAPSTSAPTPFKMVTNPLKSSIKPPPSNPLRPPPPSNVFGGGSKPAKSGDSSNGASSAAQPRTMAERIKLEEEERRKRKMSGPVPSSDRSGGVKRIRM